MGPPDLRRVTLRSGVTLEVAEREAGPAVLFLDGITDYGLQGFGGRHRLREGLLPRWPPSRSGLTQPPALLRRLAVALSWSAGGRAGVSIAGLSRRSG